MERAILVTVDLGPKDGWSAEERSAELADLARSAGAFVARQMIARREKPDPAFFVGSGKAEEVSALCKADRAGVVIFNNDLTGTQQKNLEEIIEKKVIDRTQLILDIFARRARSNEGKLQVELAQLLYLLPRLTGKGIHLSRLGGGIGTRGPGEQKLEVDRRRIRSRISHLKDRLEDLKSRRAMMREHRERFSALTIAIIGYTNTGKSTLLNALTGSGAIVQDRLFSTLDPTARIFVMPNKQKVLFVDTVGFLEDLPHHLIEAFKATLEEVVEADLLLHIIDINHPKARQHREAAQMALEEIGAGGKPVITVLNKIDRFTDKGMLERFESYFGGAAAISALKREGFGKLIERIAAYMRPLMATIKLSIPAEDAGTLSMVYANGIVKKKEYRAGRVHIEAEVTLRLKAVLDKKA